MVRVMTIEDYDEVFAMWQITSKRALSSADERSQMERYLKRNEGLSQVAVIDGKIIGTGTIASAKVAGEYFHQRRIMVTGTQMAHGSTLYAPYFNAMAVLNSTRGNVPQ